MIVGLTSIVSSGAFEFEVEAQAIVQRGRPAVLFGENAHPAEDDSAEFEWIMVSPATPGEGPWPALSALEFAEAFGTAALQKLEAEAIEEFKNFSAMMDDRRADYEYERMRDSEW